MDMLFILVLALAWNAALHAEGEPAAPGEPGFDINNLDSDQLDWVRQTVAEHGGSDIPTTADAESSGDEIDADDDEDMMDGDDGVLVLTSNNFDEMIAQYRLIMVEFYAPWCGHCKALAPAYAEVARRLKAQKDRFPDVAVAKVDATVEKEIAHKYDVSGYPTLKWFLSGEVHAYDGGRSEDEIFDFLASRADPDYKPPPPAVITLGKENFTEYIDRQDLALVEFFAPWCGHCKKLAPEYEAAAKKLKENDPPIPLFAVDGTIEKDMAEKFGATGYPTLKIFRKKRVIDYRGPRDAYGIEEYMKRQVDDASSEEKLLKHAQRTINDIDPIIMGIFENNKDPLFETYIDGTNLIRDEFTSVHTFDYKMATNFYKLDEKKGGYILLFMPLRLHNGISPRFHVFGKKDDTKMEDIEKWAHEKQVPLVGVYDTTTQRKVYGDVRPLCVLFFDNMNFDEFRSNTQKWMKRFAKIGAQFEGRMHFALASDEEVDADYMNWGLSEYTDDFSLVILGSDKKPYPNVGTDYSLEDGWDDDTIVDYIKAYFKGELKAHLRSQPVPKKNKGAVTTVVGYNFEEVVFDEEKDVLIEFYAPWCGHCKALEPEYHKLAKSVKSEKNLVIAKMDANANDAPSEYKVEGFPTIYFAPAGSDKHKPLKYESGERTAQAMETYVREHSTNSFGKTLHDEL